MPRGVPFRDKRLDNAVALYMQLWPEDGREHAMQMVQIGVRRWGVKGLTQAMQRQLGAEGQQDAQKTAEDVS